MFVLVASTAIAGAVQAQPAEEVVRFDYRAPAGCPDASAFAGHVQVRTSRARLGAPGELARTFLVEVRADASGASARLTFTDAQGGTVVRAVRGESCGEVVSAIALVTALAIDAGPSDAGETPPPAAVAPTPAKAPEPERALPLDGPRVLRAPEPDAVVWSVGLETGVTSWLGPPIATSIGVFAEVGAYAGASGRLTLLRATSSELVPLDAQAYRRGDFTALLGRIEGCPVAALLGGGFRVVPCIAVGLGTLRGEGDVSSVEPTKSSTIVWADLVPTLRLDWTLSDTLVFFAQGELGVPLVRHEFYFEGPRQDVFVVPPVGAGAAFGVAWRFP
ncbi:MAG TPA: hypothetical protein VFZ53_07635 [Polyangiaceae bacterium]